MSHNQLKLYCISGLGADERVFQNLKINADLVHLPWLEPKPSESIQDYSKRLAQSIDTSQSFGIVGLSFGGLITVEMGQFLDPKFVILISSIEIRQDIPLLYRFAGHLKMAHWFPSAWFKPPKRLVKFLFGTKNTKILYPVIEDSDPKFIKWAIQVLISWENQSRLPQSYKINGDLDRLFSPQKANNTIVIKGGHHLMILDKADEVSDHINQIIENN